jgi:hypothetical protein
MDSHPAQQIKLMWDYDCWPLWHHGDQIGNVDPLSLPISAGLRARLAAWVSFGESRLDITNPGEHLWSETDLGRFEAEGLAIWSLLQQELPSHRVYYFSEKQEALLAPDKI